MVLLSLHGLPPALIADLLDYDPATMRRWINRYNHEGLAALADRPRPGRPRLGGPHLLRRITALLTRPGPWTLSRLWRYLGRPRLSPRTLYRRVRQIAVWRRPKAVARGDPARQAVPRPHRTNTPAPGRIRHLGRRRDPPAPAVRSARSARHLDTARALSAHPHPCQEPADHGAGSAGGEHRTRGLPAGQAARGRLRRSAGAGAGGLPARPGGRGDLRQRQHPPRPRGAGVRGGPPGPARVVRGALQPARQPGRARLGRAQGVHRQHRGELAGSPAAGACLLPCSFARPATCRRRALDQPVVPCWLRARFQERRSAEAAFVAEPPHEPDDREAGLHDGEDKPGDPRCGGLTEVLLLLPQGNHLLPGAVAPRGWSPSREG
ncbi:helix-turn-helix domain-containing protein [Nocardiopsis sp. CNT-189]